MSLDQDIKVLEELVTWRAASFEENQVAAIKLGIEALKRIQATRLVRKTGPVVPLPDETEE